MKKYCLLLRMKGMKHSYIDKLKNEIREKLIGLPFQSTE